MTEMRPDADSDEAGRESEYGNDTGFAAEATRTADPAPDGTTDGSTTDGDSPDGGTDRPETTTMADQGPGDGGD